MRECNSPEAGADKQVPRKRRRIAVACKNCSARKSRCDGVQPTCSSCDEAGAKCVYLRPSQDNRPSVSAPSDDDLLLRVKTIEETFRTFQSTIPHLDCLNHTQSLLSPAEAEVNVRADAGSTAIVGDEVDGMGMMLKDDDREPDPEVAYYGISSNIILLKRVSQKIFQQLSSTQISRPGSLNSIRDKQRRSTTAGISTQDIQVCFSHSSRGIGIDKRYLPTLHEGIVLIRQYFGTVGLMIPTLHEPYFVDYFQRAVTSPKTNGKPTLLAILNVMFAFAIAVSTTSSPAHHSTLLEQSETYYLRAIALIEDNFSPSTLEEVQLSLILSNYLMGTQRSIKSWNFHALAIAGAIKLGIHSRKAGRPLSMLRQELRKRAWFWCVTNDRALSMFFGRPPMIHQSLVNLELPMDMSAEFPSKTNSNMLMACIIERYNASIALSKLIGEAVTILYNENLDSDLTISTIDLLASTLQLKWRLSQWRESLPQRLKPIAPEEVRSDNDSSAMDILRIRLFLTFQYLNTQVFISRAILFKYLDYETSSDSGGCELDLLRTSGLCHLKVCQETAKDLIELASVLLPPATETETVTFSGAWYLNSCFVFNAALSILGIMLICQSVSFEDLFDSKELTDMHKSLEKACTVLNMLHNSNPMILRCSDCLVKLMKMYDTSVCSKTELPRMPIGRRMDTPVSSNECVERVQDQRADNGFDMFGEDFNLVDMTIDLGQFVGGLGIAEDFCVDFL